jgi:twitching motility protein PilT
MAIRQTPELEQLIQQAFDNNAQFFYLVPDEPPIFRINKAIERQQADTFTATKIRDIAAAAFGYDNLKDLGELAGQLTTLCSLQGVVDAHLSVTKTGGQYCLCGYLLPVHLPDARQIRVPEAILEAATQSDGLIIFSGPSGSGKTTSMLSTLDYINRQKACIICTLEYSSLFHMTPQKAMIQQREIGVDVPDMVTGLSTSISQGSDVLMIDELRSLEDVKMSLIASQYNLVLTQLHTTTPQAGIRRLAEFFPSGTGMVHRRILAEKLLGVCTQILLERADGKGKVVACGVLIPDELMRKAILEERDVLDGRTLLPQGCKTIAQDIKQLCEEGLITQKTADSALAEKEE